MSSPTGIADVPTQVESGMILPVEGRSDTTSVQGESDRSTGINAVTSILTVSLFHCSTIYYYNRY